MPSFKSTQTRWKRFRLAATGGSVVRSRPGMSDAKMKVAPTTRSAAASQ